MICKEFEPRNIIRSLRENITIEYNPIADKGVIFYKDSISRELQSCTPEDFITMSCIWNRDYKLKMVENADLGKDAFLMRPYLES